MNRRGFLTGILAACAAPAIVRADSLMKVIHRDQLIWADEEWLTSMESPFQIYMGARRGGKIIAAAIPRLYDNNATFSEIVATTFRLHGKKFAENISRNNALYSELVKPQGIQKWLSE